MSTKQLMVITPGLNCRKSEWQSLLQRLEKESVLSNTQFYYFDHGLSLFSWSQGWTIARKISAQINALCTQNDFDDIICIGHSAGGVLIRQAYLLAAGIFDPTDQREWHTKVSRFVLLAATSRGYNPENHFLTNIVVKFFTLANIVPNILVCDLLKGSVFITNLRAGWIRHFSELQQPPAVVQLLGTEDNIVWREDCLDTELFDNAYHVDVPDAGHKDIHHLNKAPNVELRYCLIRDAVLGTEGQASPKRIPIERETVVFVLHGIRAGNTGWVEQIRSRLHEQDLKIKVVNSSYGYFSALGFAIPGRRRANLAWFRDQYSYYLARYPKAAFHFVGHSNGTYLLGQSLKEIISMRFERIYLAGSVLPREFDWRTISDRKQVKVLRNDRSAYDWPVAWLCNSLRKGFFMRDIGTGGFDGFDVDPEDCKEVFYYNGDHGKPLEEQNLDNIVAFILNDQRANPEQALLPTTEYWAVISRFCHWFLWGILLLCGLAVWALLQHDGVNWLSGMIVGLVVLVLVIILSSI